MDYRGGTLLCEEGVAVRTAEGGKIHLEGDISDLYFRIRDVVYSQFTIV